MFSGVLILSEESQVSIRLNEHKNVSTSLQGFLLIAKGCFEGQGICMTHQTAFVLVRVILKPTVCINFSCPRRS